MKEALGSASGLDVDPLPPLGHSKSDSEDSQGPLQGSAGCSYPYVLIWIRYFTQWFYPV